jgi:membrane protein YdbS with pleckstrin-like domain
MTIPNPPSKKTMKQLTTLFWIIVALFVIFIFRDMIWAILSVLWGFWQNISTIGR